MEQFVILSLQPEACKFDQEMALLHTIDQPMASLERDKGQQQQPNTQKTIEVKQSAIS